jgi:hypothetical protein
MHEPDKVSHAVATAAATPLSLVAAHVIEIAPRRITIARALRNDTPYFFVVRQRPQDAKKLVKQSYTERIFLFRPIQSQPGNAILFLDVCQDQVVVRHVRLRKFKSFNFAYIALRAIMNVYSPL